MRGAALACVLLAGCIRGNAAFHCESNADCTSGGMFGTCEPVGYCSFGDASCPSGTRFGSLSGPYANQCTSPVPGDAPMADAFEYHDAFLPADTANTAPMATVATYANSAANQSSLMYDVTVPPGASRYLIVHVQLPTNCSDASPSIASVTYAGMALSKLDTVVGTPCNESITLSEEWGLDGPPLGTAPVLITLSAVDPLVIMSAAIGFSGIDQATPIGPTAATSGNANASSLDVTSAPGDLVMNAVGQGTMVMAPGAGQTKLLIDNLDSVNNLDNLGVSWRIANAATTTMTWTFGITDDWQSISIVLRPAS
jgi:hypothetical protein